MPRLLFTKTEDAVWMSHLDLMRLFQRAFKRAGLPLTHTKGFNPRPSVSIALPLSVGVESKCELLDFDLEGENVSGEEIMWRLNPALVPGVQVLSCYDSGKKIRDLSLLRCSMELEYDAGVPAGAAQALEALFSRDTLTVEKHGKKAVVQQDIIPMIRSISFAVRDAHVLVLNGLICCQNPSLNPMQLAVAIGIYAPDLKPDFVRCRREEIYDTNETIFR